MKLRELLGGAPFTSTVSGAPVSPGADGSGNTASARHSGEATFTDRTRDVLTEAEARCQALEARLARAKPTFAALQTRGLTDAQAAEDARTLSAEIVADEQMLPTLVLEMGVAEQAVRRHASLAAAFFQDIEATRARLEPLVAALDGLEEELQWAVATSRALDVQAATLLAVTGDRQFRRVLDPRGAILLALQELIASLTRAQARKERVS